jgi:hypothetical protein
LERLGLLLQLRAAGFAGRAERLADVSQVAERDRGLLSYQLRRCGNGRDRFAPLVVGSGVGTAGSSQSGRGVAARMNAIRSGSESWSMPSQLRPAAIALASSAGMRAKAALRSLAAPSFWVICASAPWAARRDRVPPRLGCYT